MTVAELIEKLRELPQDYTVSASTQDGHSYNKLLNVSIWLNDGWEPNWANPKEKKWFICYNAKTNNYSIHYTTNKKSCNVYFKNKRLCKTAIEIMGDYYMANIFDENIK